MRILILALLFTPLAFAQTYVISPDGSVTVIGEANIAPAECHLEEYTYRQCHNEPVGKNGKKTKRVCEDVTVDRLVCTYKNDPIRPLPKPPVE